MYGALPRERGSFQGDSMSVDLDASDEDHVMLEAPPVARVAPASSASFAPVPSVPLYGQATAACVDLDASDEDEGFCQPHPVSRSHSSGNYMPHPTYQMQMAPPAFAPGRSYSFNATAGAIPPYSVGGPPQLQHAHLARSASDGIGGAFSLSHSGDSLSNQSAGSFFSLGSSMEISAGPMAQSFLRSSGSYEGGMFESSRYGAPHRVSLGAEMQTYDLDEEEEDVTYKPVAVTYVAGHVPEQIIFTAEAEEAAEVGEAVVPVLAGGSSVLQKGEQMKLEQHLSSSSWIAKMNDEDDPADGGLVDASGIVDILEDETVVGFSAAADDYDVGEELQVADEELQRREEEAIRVLAEKETKARRQLIVDGQWKRVKAMLKERGELKARKGVMEYRDNWRERIAYEYDEEDEELLAALCKKSDSKDSSATIVPSELLLEEEERTERFFSHGRTKVSSNSIHDIGLLDEKEMEHVLHSAKEFGSKKKRMLFRTYREKFPLWKGQMHEGFNIVLYGLGSKKKLMESFAEEELSDHVRLVVNGYFPSLSLKRILLSLSQGLFRCESVPSDLLSHATMVAELLSDLPDSDPTRVCLVVNSIDGVALRTQKAQEILCQLAAQPRIHMIASVDHLSAPFLWDYYMAGKFNFLWYETATFTHYTHETRYESSIFSRGTKGSLGIRAAIMVLEGLPRKAHEVFKILAMHQVKTSKGMIFQDLFRASREQFLVSRPNQLQAFLNEFREHKLIKLTANRKDGTQQYVIMMPTAYIHKIVADIQVGLHAVSSADKAA